MGTQGAHRESYLGSIGGGPLVGRRVSYLEGIGAVMHTMGFIQGRILFKTCFY